MNSPSPRIEQFTVEMATDLAAATDRLRADLQAAGGPLVESASDDGRLLVTFVWIGPAESVAARGTQLFPDQLAPFHPLTRVEGSDVWHLSVPAPADVATVYQYLLDLPPAASDPSLVGGDFMKLTRIYLDAGTPDPFNPARIYPQPGVIVGDMDLPQERWESILELPEATHVPWFDDGDAPAGTLTEHRLASEALSNERTITVYTPAADAQAAAGLDAGAPLPLVVVLDGECWPRIARLHVALDNLIAARAIEPLIVAFVHNPPSDDPMHARTREAVCNPDFTRMLADELVPFLRSRHAIADDPSRTIVHGNSLSALAAAYAAFERPETFGGVMATSGSFTWGYADHPIVHVLGGRDDEPEWITRQYALAEHRPIRFWLDVGSLETGSAPWTQGVDQRAATRHLRTVLQAKGNDVTYHEAPGGHEFHTFRRSLVAGLQKLLPGTDPAT